MARGRMISKTLGESRKFAALNTDIARVVYTLVVANVDKAGRLEADPLYITRKVCTRLPYTTEDIDAALQDMARVGLIILYESRGVPALQIVDFDKHNKPHHKEPDSEIDPPPEGGSSDTDTKVRARAKHDSSMGHARMQARANVADNGIEISTEEGEGDLDHSEDRMARAFATGKPQAAPKHRVRAELRRLAGPEFVQGHEQHMDSWTRWSNDQLRAIYEASDPSRWPQEGHKKRAWILKDLLNEERPMPRQTQVHETPDVRAMTRQILVDAGVDVDELDREFGVN